MKKKLIILTISLLLLGSFGLQAKEYPLRSEYPTVEPISTQELDAKYDQYTIVDVRSKFEFDVIHIKKSSHIPISKLTFSKKLSEIVVGDKNKAIAFYCNGITCAKSYKAVEKAIELGYTATKVYDDGIFEWTVTYPEKAVLLGKSPVDARKLIPDSKFEEHLMDKEIFAEKSKSPNAVLFDLRDPIQRAKNPAFGKKTIRIDMDKFIKNLAKPQFRKQMGNKELYIFDAVGRQVRWLQYYMEEENIKNYTFLKNGAWSIFGAKGATK